MVCFKICTPFAESCHVTLKIKNAMKYLKLIFGAILLSAIFFFSCNNSDQLIKDGKGRLNVHITDSPFPIDLVSSTMVTFDKVEIRKKAGRFIFCSEFVHCDL